MDFLHHFRYSLIFIKRPNFEKCYAPPGVFKRDFTVCGFRALFRYMAI